MVTTLKRAEKLRQGGFGRTGSRKEVTTVAMCVEVTNLAEAQELS